MAFNAGKPLSMAGLKALAPGEATYGLTIAPTLLTPDSKGTIRLVSADSFAYPSIDPK
jgi:hypothetical protein